MGASQCGARTPELMFGGAARAAVWGNEPNHLRSTVRLMHVVQYYSVPADTLDVSIVVSESD